MVDPCRGFAVRLRAATSTEGSPTLRCRPGLDEDWSRSAGRAVGCPKRDRGGLIRWAALIDIRKFANQGARCWQCGPDRGLRVGGQPSHRITEPAFMRALPVPELIAASGGNGDHPRTPIARILLSLRRAVS